MAQSIGGKVPAPGAKFLHGLSSSTLKIEIKNDQMIHTIRRDGLEASYPIALSIGSGRVGQSYAVRIDGGFFQSPISWYRQTSKWGMSPGFEGERHPDFDRPITGSCLFCHGSETATGPTGITCDRCHGDAARHVVAPSKSNIIHPTRLTAGERDAVCEQCHLQGAARILQPGKTERDFLPGMRLEAVFSVFVRRNEDFRVVSHAEQLRESACSLASAGRLWCGTCHNPHPARPATRADYQSHCESCHVGIRAKHSGAVDDCIGCHMPVRQVSDVAHTVYTDHRISKRPTEVKASLQAARELVPWRPVNDGGRSLALAYASTGSLEAASAHLTPLLAQRTNDVELLVAGGSVALGLGRPKEALRYFSAARRLDSEQADHYFREGLAHEALGDIPSAITDYQEALKRRNGLFDAMARLAVLERSRGDTVSYKQALTYFLKSMPQNLTVRKLLREVPP